MAKRGVRKHLKRISAPKHWMLSKVGGIWATKSSQGPHKLRESMPLTVLLRNKLKLALTGREAKLIVMAKEGNIAVDGKVRKDPKYPVGFMDVITLIKAKTNYRLLYDVKGKIFSTRLSNVFIIGENKEDVTVLKTHTRYSVIEEREYRMGKKKVDDEDTA